jgi:hypothetical protein
LIGSPIGQNKTVLYQQTFQDLDQSHAKISACAWCCKHLVSPDNKEGLVQLNINDLPPAFLLTDVQIQQLTSLPKDIVDKHVQVLKHDGHFYHLNPDLVYDTNAIVLCPVYAKDLMMKKDKSIAAGNDYGQLGYLKPLNSTTRNACVHIRLYNFNLQIRANHSTNHSIAFPINCSVECLKQLPCVDVNHQPQVTFLGPRDEWQKVVGKYKHLYEMDTDIAYEWLQFWVNANHPSFKNCIID